MKKNVIFIILLIAISFYCYGQALTFSPTIRHSKSLSVSAISQLWNDYITSLRENQSDSIQKSFWLNESDDLLKERPPTNFYQVGNLLTFNIRKHSDTIYEIHSMQQVIGENPDVLFIYKVCAINTKGTFKLLNYFDAIKQSLQNFHSESIEFYYPYGFSFDKERVREIETFIHQFRKDYHISSSGEKIFCLIGNSFSEAISFLGFSFMIGTDENKYAGMYKYPKTIVCQRQDHIHEFVHALMFPQYPNALDILHEGIATYYGGTSGLEYYFLRNNLREYMVENFIDFSNASSLWTDRIDGTPLGYIVGALVIEYVLKNHGTPKIIELFSCESYEDIFQKIGIKTEDINIFFNKLIDKKHE
jgi:hypothetical protein